MASSTVRVTYLPTAGFSSNLHRSSAHAGHHTVLIGHHQAVLLAQHLKQAGHSAIDLFMF
jgi:hypothetical protein